MPFDALCISAVTDELRKTIQGGRIDKVQQPDRDKLVISLRAGGNNYRLLLSAGTGTARIHLTNNIFENPAEPPMFCMLMRKHLTGARISNIFQPDGERMVVMELEGHDDMGFSDRKTLYVELIGRSSNIILADAEGRIIDCIRRMDYGGDSLRRMLPGMIYRYPPKQSKAYIIETDSAQREKLIEKADRSIPVDKFLLDSFSGLSPLICRELSFRSGGEYDDLSLTLDAFCESIQAKEFCPCLFVRDGRPEEFSFMPLHQYGDMYKCVKYDSFSEMLDGFYSQRDRLDQQRRRSRNLMKSVKTVRDRLERKLAGQSEELRRTEGKDEIRKTAELITANMFRIKKGDRTLSCENYFEPDCPEVCIPLDPMKTPQQNASALFKEYNKLKGAEKHLTVLIKEGQQQLDYLNSVLEFLETAESEKDISDIRRELMETGYIREQKNAKRDKSRSQLPRRFVSDDSFEILVGRSNIQNDELTVKIGRRTDYWLHTQKIHGSHVIIRCDGAEPSERTITQAAQIAAYYSQARGTGKTPVDYTMLRNVHKPSGALPGKVVYTDFKTVVVESDEELVRRLSKE